jgi:hypothetical protein
MFGRLCEPPLDPAWPSSLRSLIGDTPPPAYALWDLQDRRLRLEAGSEWGFELTLVGELALRQIPAIVAAVQQGAEQGMGRVRLRSRVLRVHAITAGQPPVEHCLAAEQPQGEELALTWQSYRLEDIAFGYEQAAQWAASQEGPIRSLSLRYLSPVKVKEHGRWIKEPRFDAIMYALVRRLRLLSQVHGAGEWPQAEFGPLLDLAKTVRLEHDETLQSGYSRHSRQSGLQQIEGIVGQAWYAGEDLRPLLPILWLGQWLHIGKAYVLGNGRYVIESVS